MKKDRRSVFVFLSHIYTVYEMTTKSVPPAVLKVEWGSRVAMTTSSGSREERVMGGEEAERGEAPWTVR